MLTGGVSIAGDERDAARAWSGRSRSVVQEGSERARTVVSSGERCGGRLVGSVVE